MKKALCFFMAIVFVCCVITYGKNERFSVEAMLNNITNFQNMPTLEDFGNVWGSDYYWVEGAISLPRLRYYVIPPTLVKQPDGTTIKSEGVYVDDIPVALDSHGRDISDQYSHLTIRYEYIYDPDTLLHVPVTFDDGSVSYGPFPYITDAKEAYSKYVGDNPILEFFDSLKAFFLRVGNTCSLAVDFIFSIFRNLKYLLPWNNTVPRGQW